LITALLTELWQLCLFRSSPSRLPGPWILTMVLIALDWLVSLLVVVQLSPDADRGTMLVSIGLSNLVLLVLIMVTLAIRNRSSRAPQTLSAIFGCDLVLTMLFGVLLGIAAALGDSLGTTPTAMLQVLLVLWTITLYGYILHEALDMPQVLGTLVAFAILMAGLSVSQMFIETPSP
jgi:hypothetical protein